VPIGAGQTSAMADEAILCRQLQSRLRRALVLLCLDAP
jgi:hypothetical protein